jgi:hypothetical protein
MRSLERQRPRLLLVLLEPPDEAAEAGRVRIQKIPRYMPPST